MLIFVFGIGTFQVATFGNFGETYGLTGLKRFLRRCSTFSRGSLFTINQKLKTQTYLVKMNMHVAYMINDL